MIIFPIGSSGQRLVFPDHVIDRLLSYRQLRCWHKEAGGQLFARLNLPDIIIEDITGTGPEDLRGRFSYEPNRNREQDEINERHKLGLCYVGDWHTHPEDVPSPSPTDLRSMSDTFQKSIHALNFFILLILGRKDPPDGWSLTLVGAKNGNN